MQGRRGHIKENSVGQYRDSKYLAPPFVTTTDFKKEPDGTQWNPEPCTSR